jgi:methylated-DNA-[protein]-cysteine S-methyltransferase
MNADIIYSYVESPLGQMLVRGDGQFVIGLFMPDHKGGHRPDPSWQLADEPFAAIHEQLAEYFAGERRQFTVPLRMTGTPFQRRVWQELVRIPFGATISYAELARRIGQPTASRAVGHANSRNPVSILVPCHRVIGANGKLTGYAGGIDRKQWLLDWERHAVSQMLAEECPRRAVGMAHSEVVDSRTEAETKPFLADARRMVPTHLAS